MKDVMLNIETMGIGADAAVIAIGAAFFGNGKIGRTFHRRIPIEDAEKYGKIDGSTVRWWMQQSDKARKRVMDSDKGDTIGVLLDFAKFLGKDKDDVKIWGNGASFDNVILAGLYKRAGLEQPWKFWNDRCYRTIKALSPNTKIKHKGVEHDALDDAIAQAKHLMRITEKAK